MLNPVAAVPFQILSSIVGEPADVLKSFIFVIPCMVGGVVGGLVMRYLY